MRNPSRRLETLCRVSLVAFIVSWSAGCSSDKPVTGVSLAPPSAAHFECDQWEPGCDEPDPGAYSEDPTYDYGPGVDSIGALPDIETADALGQSYQNPILPEYGVGWTLVAFIPSLRSDYFPDVILYSAGTAVLSGTGRAWVTSHIYNYMQGHIPFETVQTRYADNVAKWGPWKAAANCKVSGMDVSVDSDHRVSFSTLAYMGKTSNHKACYPGSGVRIGGSSDSQYTGINPWGDAGSICWEQDAWVSYNGGYTWREEQIRICV